MIITERRAYAAFRAADDTPTFNAWGAAQRLTTATEPRVRGTRSMGGGLLPLRNARHVIDERVPDVAPEPAPVAPRRSRRPVRDTSPGPATRIDYWILLADGNAWVNSDVDEIQDFMAQGFTPTVRVTPVEVIISRYSADDLREYSL